MYIFLAALGLALLLALVALACACRMLRNDMRRGKDCMDLSVPEAAANTRWAPYAAEVSESIKRLRALPWEEVRISAAEGFPLRARLLRGTSGDTAILVHGYRSCGELDFALVEGYFRPDAYETMVYRTEPYIPVCAKGHAFSHPVHRLKDLLSQRLLVREMGSGTRDILEKNLALRGMRIEDFSHVTQVESTRLIVSLLVQDCGIAFLYQAAVRRELAEGTLVQIPLADFSMEHDFVFLWNRTSAFSSEYAHICHALSTL